MGVWGTTGGLRGDLCLFLKLNLGRCHSALRILTFKGQKNLVGVREIKWGVAKILKQHKSHRQKNR